MKKIVSIMSFICLLAFSGHVFAHVNGPKKAFSIEQSFNQVTPGYDSISDAVNISFINAEVSVNFMELTASNFITHDVVFLNLSGNFLKKQLRSNYALIPDRIFIEHLHYSYLIIPATPLPKHYLLPCKNHFWLSGNDQRSC